MRGTKIPGGSEVAISTFFSFKFEGGAFPDSGCDLGTYTDSNPILGERVTSCLSGIAGTAIAIANLWQGFFPWKFTLIWAYNGSEGLESKCFER